MTSPDMLSINNVAAKLGLSVHQLRRWELMFGLEIKRGRGQQRQYREEDMSVLERIKELVEQGWPTSQIRPQLEAEGLLSPRLIGVTPAPGNPEVLQEAIIGLRNFNERRFIDISKQIDELRQLVISITMKQEIAADRNSPWQPLASEFVPAPKQVPPQEITIGPQISIDPPKSMPSPMPNRVNQIPPMPSPMSSSMSSSTPTAPSSALSSSLSNSAASGANTDFSHRSVIPGTPMPGMSAASDSGRSSFAPNSSSTSGGGTIIGAPTPSTSSSTSNPSVIGSTSSSTQIPALPGLESAPKPISDALQRSMSTLDSLFKDPRNSLGTSSSSSIPAVSSSGSAGSTGTASSTQHPAIASGFESDTPAPPVRHSTIPPLPVSAPATAPASAPMSSAANFDVAGSAPAVTASNASSPNLSAASPSPALPASPTSAAPSAQASYPGAATGSNPGDSPFSSQNLSPSSPMPSSPMPAAAPAKVSAWDQAFASTSVDMNAVPSSGLFEESKPAAPAAPNATSSPSSYPSAFSAPTAGTNSNPVGTASGTNSGINSASLEHNPFTTITGTNYPAVGDKASPYGSGGYDGAATSVDTAATSSEAAPSLNQTGPLPAHIPVESFAPDKGKLIESQSNSTSTELPQTDESDAPTSATGQAGLTAPAAPPGALITPGPQMNFGPNVSAPTPQVTPQRTDDNFGLGEVTDQNYLTVLGRALDLIGWSDEQADSYSLKTFGVPHWDELGRSQAEKLVAHLVSLLKDQLG